jgi:hypothetical protein
VKAALAIFDMLPGWVWAVICAALLATNCATHGRLTAEKMAHAQTRQVLAEERKRAAEDLGQATGAVLRLERELGDLKARQEAEDEKRKMDRLAARDALAAAAGPAGRLRDPNATAPRCPADGPAAPAPAGGAADAAEAGGLLSAPLTRLLRELQLEADTINDAYASCRADALRLRERVNQLSPPVEPVLQAPARPD